MIMKIKDVFQRKWITDSITKRRYPFQIPSMTGLAKILLKGYFIRWILGIDV